MATAMPVTRPVHACLDPFLVQHERINSWSLLEKSPAGFHIAYIQSPASTTLESVSSKFESHLAHIAGNVE